jgi:hypothetical protein
MEFGTSEELRVVYITFIGKDTEGLNIYQFLLSNNPDDVFAEGWDEKPANIIRHEILMIDESQYEYIKELRTDIILDLAQDNGCFSMQDCRDHCVALAYENLDMAEEYPENGRIVVQFGDTLTEVEEMFARRDMTLKYV